MMMKSNDDDDASRTTRFGKRVQKILDALTGLSSAIAPSSLASSTMMSADQALAVHSTRLGGVDQARMSARDGGEAALNPVFRRALIEDLLFQLKSELLPLLVRLVDDEFSNDEHKLRFTQLVKIILESLHVDMAEETLLVYITVLALEQTHDPTLPMLPSPLI